MFNSIAVIWHVEHLYMSYSFQVMHKGKKTMNKVKIFTFNFVALKKH